MPREIAARDVVVHELRRNGRPERAAGAGLETHRHDDLATLRELDRVADEVDDH
jgi:hypothetical protein